MTATLTVHKIEDYAGEGRCSACRRNGLRWVVTLSDGSQVGTECTVALIGRKVSLAGLREWVPMFRIVAEHTDTDGAHHVMWQRINGSRTCETVDATLVSVGGVRAAWAARGWAVPDV